MMRGLFGLPASLYSAGQKATGDFAKGYGSAYGVPGIVDAGNIDLTNRPIVRNPDGSISTVRSMSANFDGMEYLLPTVSKSGRIMTDDQAIRSFLRSGEHLGVFETPEAASTWAEKLHNEQANQYARSRSRGLFGGTGR